MLHRARQAGKAEHLCASISCLQLQRQPCEKLDQDMRVREVLWLSHRSCQDNLTFVPVQIPWLSPTLVALPLFVLLGRLLVWATEEHHKLDAPLSKHTDRHMDAKLAWFCSDVSALTTWLTLSLSRSHSVCVCMCISCFADRWEERLLVFLSFFLLFRCSCARVHCDTCSILTLALLFLFHYHFFFLFRWTSNLWVNQKPQTNRSRSMNHQA